MIENRFERFWKTLQWVYKSNYYNDHKKTTINGCEFVSSLDILNTVPEVIDSRDG